MVERIYSIFLFFIISFALFGVINFIYHEYKWFKAPCIIEEATLVKRKFEKGRNTTSFAYVPRRGVIPVFSMSSEQYITIWDIEDYGVHICDKKNVFNNAKERSLLEIKVIGEEVRIESIRS